MLTALLNGDKVLATDPKWENRREEFRELCNNHAVCPVCLEPVVCKFGKVKIHHYAHSQKANCPGTQDTEEHMKGKVILHSFLQDRFRDMAEIEVEAILPGLSYPSDILLTFSNGRRWALEYYCGHIKEATLREKLSYYKRENIDALWLVAGERYQPITPNNLLKIKSTERNLISDTGMDKFYASAWYQMIVENRMDFSLPKDGTTRGTIHFFYTDQMKIVMARALRETDHVTVFQPGVVLEGQLEDVNISDKRNIWYFDQEKSWKNKYQEAHVALAEIKKAKAQLEAQQKARQEKQFKQSSRWLPTHKVGSPSTPINPLRTTTATLDNKIYLTAPGKFKCIDCGGEFLERDMVTYQKISKEGTCRECMKKRGKG